MSTTLGTWNRQTELDETQGLFVELRTFFRFSSFGFKIQPFRNAPAHKWILPQGADFLTWHWVPPRVVWFQKLFEKTYFRHTLNIRLSDRINIFSLWNVAYPFAYLPLCMIVRPPFVIRGARLSHWRRFLLDNVIQPQFRELKMCSNWLMKPEIRSHGTYLVCVVSSVTFW